MSQNIKNPKYNLELEKILDNFPKLKEWKYYFNEFKIGNEKLYYNNLFSIFIRMY